MSKPESTQLLTHTVAKNIFGFLPLNDIKNGRLVCTKWNFAAEPFMRKLASVRFSSNFRPEYFYEYSKVHYPDLPFTAFRLAGTFDGDGWTTTELQSFFERWGVKIKCLEFLDMWIKKYSLEDMSGPKQISYMRDWFSLTPNLIQLTVTGDNSQMFIFDWDTLSSLKILKLRGCRVSLNRVHKKVTPTKIYLRGIEFSRNGFVIEEVTVNDFVDFTKCSEIELYASGNVMFDISKDNIDAQKINLNHIHVLNWQLSNAKTEYLKLSSCPFIVKSPVQTKEFIFEDSNINLSLLPVTTEKLEISDVYCTEELMNPGQVNVPNMRSVRLMDRMISPFSNCPGLVDIELKEFESSLRGNYDPYRMNVGTDLPRSVRRLKMPSALEIDGDDIINVDLLILGTSDTPCANAERVLRNIKPKVLVLSFAGPGALEESDDLFAFVLKNTFVEKIIVSLPNGLRHANLFNIQIISRIGGKKATFYQFYNNFGISITEKAFLGHFIMN